MKQSASNRESDDSKEEHPVIRAAHEPVWGAALPLDVLEVIAMHTDPKTYVRMMQCCTGVHARLANHMVLTDAKYRFARPITTGNRVKITRMVLPGGEEHGTVERRNKAGVRTRLEHYEHDELHGTEEWWNDAGMKTYRTHWEHGEQHGTEEWWNDEGVRTYLGHYEHSERHGTEEWWNDAGVRTCLAHWTHNKRHGTLERWNDAGVRTYLGHYEHGTLDQGSRWGVAFLGI